MRRLLAIFLLALAPAARAQPSHPPVLPTRDVTVTYALSGQVGGARGPQSLRLAIEAGGERARVETDAIGGYMIANRPRAQLLVVLDQLGAYTELRGAMAQAESFLPNDGMHFTRRGNDTILGLACTVWDVQGANFAATGCVTSDGVILRGQAHTNRGDGRIVATEVTYGHIPDSAFQVPRGLRRLDLPANVLGNLPK